MQAKYILSNIKDSCLMLFDLENEAATLTSFQGDNVSLINGLIIQINPF